MRSYSIAALAAIVATVIAAPAPVADNQVPEGAFTVHQVAVGKKVKNGPAEMAKTYRKYNKTPPSNVVAAADAVAAAAVQSGTVAASPTTDDSEYLCPVSVGGKTLNLDFDTGSSDLWVFSSLLPKSERSGHSYYTPGSSAVKKTGETWNIEYGDGSSAGGVVYADTVVIGGVTATSQSVEAATAVSSEFVGDTSNGLVGLAFDSINTCSPNVCGTFMDTVYKTLPQPLFAAYLKKGAVGAYDFGFVNSNHYTGAITTVTVNKANGFWEFTAQGYAINGAATTLSLDSIVDTGTTLLYLPTSVVQAYYAKVSGAQNSESAGGYIVPCSATLPSLAIIINGVQFTVPGTYFNYAPYSGSNCYGALQSSEGIGFNILGDIFIKSQYVIFTLGSSGESSTSTLGFATQK